MEPDVKRALVAMYREQAVPMRGGNVMDRGAGGKIATCWTCRRAGRFIQPSSSAKAGDPVRCGLPVLSPMPLEYRSPSGPGYAAVPRWWRAEALAKSASRATTIVLVARRKPTRPSPPRACACLSMASMICGHIRDRQRVAHAVDHQELRARDRPRPCGVPPAGRTSGSAVPWITCVGGVTLHSALDRGGRPRGSRAI